MCPELDVDGLRVLEVTLFIEEACYLASAHFTQGSACREQFCCCFETGVK